MPRFTHESLTVWWVPTIVNKAAPTVAEITAGTILTTFTPVDGVNIGGSSNNASQAMLGDAFVAEEPGTWSRSLEITFVRDDTTDTVYALFAGGYKTAGYIVLRRTGTGAAVAAQKVEVFPVKTHEALSRASAENEYAKFTVNFAVTSKPEVEAVVAA
jgi:hypothetical protein